MCEHILIFSVVHLLSCMLFKYRWKRMSFGGGREGCWCFVYLFLWWKIKSIVSFICEPIIESSPFWTVCWKFEQRYTTLVWDQDFLLSHGHSMLANEWINLKAFLKELICLWSQVETNSLYFPVCSYNYSRNKDWNWFSHPFTSSHDSFSINIKASSKERLGHFSDFSHSG